MCTVKKICKPIFPHNSKTKRDIAKISAVLKPTKSDYYVVKFWQNRSTFIFLGLKGFFDTLIYEKCLPLRVNMEYRRHRYLEVM